MDIDETYIRQCDCPEIQGRWKPKEGDRLSRGASVWCINDIAARCFGADDTLGWGKKSVLWLPRQEDIQEMLPKEYITVAAMLSHFYRWTMDEDFYLEDAFAGNETMEMLWLAFYMHEVHNKAWTEKGWQ